MKRKYPWSMFFMDVIIFLLKTWYASIVIIFIFILRLIMLDIPLAIVPILVIVWVILAITRAVIHKNALLNMNPNEETNALLDKMFANNDKGYKNVVEAVDEIIKEYNDKSNT